LFWVHIFVILLYMASAAKHLFSCLLVGFSLAAPVFAACPPPGALKFDGIDDYVALPDNEPVWLPDRDFTLSVWVCFQGEATTEHELILDLNFAASTHPANKLGYNLSRRTSDGRIAFQMTTGPGQPEYMYIDDILLRGKWYHLAAVRNNTTQAVYIDGMLNKSRTCSHDRIDFVGRYDDDKVNVGRATTEGGSPRFHLKGIIDEVAIFDRALTAEQIHDLYCYGPATHDPNLLGYWDFNEGQGQTAYDLSGNGRNGRLGGDPCNPVWVESAVSANICYVDDDAPADPCRADPNTSDPLEDGSCMHPFDSIQEAVDKARENTTGCCPVVLVRDGIYTGCGNFDIDPNGLEITIKSENGPKRCFIYCRNEGRAFLFQNSEDSNTTVCGFTIIRGHSNENGGAIYCNAASPAIVNCTLIGNNADWSGGAIFVGYDSRTVIRNCRIMCNYCGAAAGGIYSHASSPVIENCLITRNYGYWSGGLSANTNSHAVVTNCTIAHNHSTDNPCGMECYQGSAIILNSIFWANSGWQIRLEEGGNVSVTYSDIPTVDPNDPNFVTAWPGLGNISAEPLFAASALLDYHLTSTTGHWQPLFSTNGDFNDDGWVDLRDLKILAQFWLQSGLDDVIDLSDDSSINLKDYAVLAANWNKIGKNAGGWVPDLWNSPCIDAGDPNSDYSREPQPNGDRINIGAYGNTEHASKSSNKPLAGSPAVKTAVASSKSEAGLQGGGSAAAARKSEEPWLPPVNREP